MFVAPDISSTIEYMFVTFPTFNLSCKLQKFKHVPQLNISTPFSSNSFKSSIESDPSVDNFTPPLYKSTDLGSLSN